jgi:hypothetical protein
MTSASTFPQRLTKIDDLARPDHFYLTPDDECYFLGEYTARKGYAFSATNQLILNFKKSMDKRATAQWRYKEKAIAEAAAAFRAALNKELLDIATLVPIPPSKTRNDALYDDRLVRMLRGIRVNPKLDVRELVFQRASTAAVHDQENRPTPDAWGSLSLAAFQKPPILGNSSYSCRIPSRQTLSGVLTTPGPALHKEEFPFGHSEAKRDHRYISRPNV